MPNARIYNPWKPEAPKSATPAERASTRAAVDLGLTDVIGDFTEVTAEPTAANDDFLQELDDRCRFGTSAPRGQKLTLDETRKSLETMRSKIDDARYKRVTEEIFPRLLESAETHLPEHNLARKFLRAVVDKDKASMTEIIKLMGAPTQ